nr:DUF202 domain-containing protein [Mycobacterium sp. DL440]
MLANGALLMVRDVDGYDGPRWFLVVGLAVTIALSTALIGVRRQRALRSRPLPQRITPRREMLLTGVSVLVLTLVSALALSV